jgi:hypothetical protein
MNVNRIRNPYFVMPTGIDLRIKTTGNIRVCVSSNAVFAANDLLIVHHGVLATQKAILP